MAHIIEVHPTPGGKPHLKQSVLSAEIVRAGGSVDLLERDMQGVEIVTMLFPGYFLAGYSASQASPEQIASVLDTLHG